MYVVLSRRGDLFANEPLACNAVILRQAHGLLSRSIEYRLVIDLNVCMGFSEKILSRR